MYLLQILKENKRTVKEYEWLGTNLNEISKGEGGHGCLHTVL